MDLSRTTPGFSSGIIFFVMPQLLSAPLRQRSSYITGHHETRISISVSTIQRPLRFSMTTYMPVPHSPPHLPFK
jgi:hypothetical protein